VTAYLKTTLIQKIYCVVVLTNVHVEGGPQSRPVHTQCSNISWTARHIDIGRPCTAPTPAATPMLSHYRFFVWLATFQILLPPSTTYGLKLKKANT